MSENEHYIIDLSRLEIGTHSFDILLDDDFFASLEKSEILKGQVQATMRLNLREEDYTLDIAVHGTVVVVCDRCLEPMPIDIDDKQLLDASEIEEPVTRNLSSVTSKLDLSWLAYEIVSVNIPLVHSHQPGGCNPQMDLLLHSHLCEQPDPDMDN